MLGPPSDGEHAADGRTESHMNRADIPTLRKSAEALFASGLSCDESVVLGSRKTNG